MNYDITNENQKQPEFLSDSRFAWRERKMGTIRLAKLYDMAGFVEYAERARTCATWLQYLAQSDGQRQLYAANFCQLRLCPLCTVRRAKRAARKLSDVMDGVQRENPGVQYVFLTLTVKNCAGPELNSTIQHLLRSWHKLIKHRPFQRGTVGWFRALEITRNGKDYHPHIHAIVAVPDGYFARGNRMYITHAKWVEQWQLALGVDYKPSVRISKTKGGDGGRDAALEAAKYTTKSSDYIDANLPDKDGARIVNDYTLALSRKRLTAYGGVMRDMARRLDAEDLESFVDLVHIDDQTLRQDVAELMEDYHWNFGAGDFVLTTRRDNPLFGVPKDATK